MTFIEFFFTNAMMSEIMRWRFEPILGYIKVFGKEWGE